MRLGALLCLFSKRSYSAKHLLLTFDDVTLPHDCKMSHNKVCTLVANDGHEWCHPWYNLLLQRAFVKNEPTIFSPLTSNGKLKKLTWRLTLGRHPYTKSEINCTSSRLLRAYYILNPTTSKALGHLVWLWHGRKVAKRWCEVGSFKRTRWPDLAR